MKSSAIAAKTATARTVENLTQDEHFWEKTQENLKTGLSVTRDVAHKTVQLTGAGLSKVDELSGHRASTFAEESGLRESSRMIGTQVEGLGKKVAGEVSKIFGGDENGANEKFEPKSFNLDVPDPFADPPSADPFGPTTTGSQQRSSGQPVRPSTGGGPSPADLDIFAGPVSGVSEAKKKDDANAWLDDFADF